MSPKKKEVEDDTNEEDAKVEVETDKVEADTEAEVDYEEFESASVKVSPLDLESDDAPELEVTDLPGVGPAIGKRLAEAGYKSVEAIAVASPRELAAAGSIG